MGPCVRRDDARGWLPAFAGTTVVMPCERRPSHLRTLSTRRPRESGEMESRLKCNDGFEFGECLGGCLEVQAFAWGVVEALHVPLEGGCRDELEVSFAWQ